jgi:hypothetical protein
MTATDGSGRAWPLLWWLLSLIGAVWLFAWLGQGPMAAPPIGDLAELRAWYAERTPPEALFAGARLLVLALGWYLLGATTIGAVARVMRAARLVAVADFLTVPAVRRLLQGALGVGLAAAAVTSVPAAHTVGAGPSAAHALADPDFDSGSPPAEGGPLLRMTEEATQATPAAAPAVVDGPNLTMSHEPAAAPPTSPTVEDDRDDVELAVNRQAAMDAPDSVLAALPPALAAPSTAAASVPHPPEDSVEVSEAGDEGDVEHQDIVDPDAEAPDTNGLDAEVPAISEGEARSGSSHVIVAGEHLWSIAETTLADAGDGDPTDAEIARYWQSVIDLNRDRLPDPGNPDLVHPGLRIELPPLP